MNRPTFYRTEPPARMTRTDFAALARTSPELAALAALAASVPLAQVQLWQNSTLTRQPSLI
jgi:hypothetical protein